MSAVPFEITCDDKLRLWIEYQKRTAEYSAAVSKLAIRRMSKDEYERLAAIAENARRASQEARENLNRHRAEHGC